jgi:site-specific recombinase XerD
MSNPTIHEAAQAYLEHLREQGKKERTIYTYAKDFEIIESFFDGGKPLASIRTPQVGKFFKSDLLLKLPSGKERAKPTLDKTVRVFRMFLVWAKATGHLDALPLPKDTPMGHSRKKGNDDDDAQ